MAKISELVQQLGPGWKLVGAGVPVEETKTIPNPEWSSPVPPKAGTPQTISSGTGRYYVVVQDDAGHQRAQFLTPSSDQGVEGPGLVPAPPISGRAPDPGTRPVAGNELASLNWDPAGPVEDVPAGAGVKTPEERAAELEQTKAQTAASQATAAHTGASTRELEGQNAQRDANQAKGLGWLTDAEVQKTSQDAAQLGLTAEGLKIRREELGQQARNQAVQNQISARNTDIAAANQSLNERKTQLDELYRTNQITLDQAKLQYQEAKDTADRDIAASRLDLERLSQQQSNQIAQQNVGLNRETLEQRKAEAAQTQQTNQLQAQTAAQTAATGQQNAATTAASTILQNQAQGGTAGASLLNQRVQAGQGMLSSILGMAGQRPLVGLPAGIGQMLMGDIQGMTAQLGGGQAVYDTAARLVQAADPQNGQSPQAQVAYGVLTQMLERYQQQTGQPHPAVTATMATTQSQQANGLVAPSTGAAVTPATAPQTMPWNGGVPAAGAPPMIAGATPFMNAGTRYYGNGGLPSDQTAPVAAVPSANYGAAPAYTGGVPPWLVQPGTFMAPPMPPPLTARGVLGR